MGSRGHATATALQAAVVMANTSPIRGARSSPPPTLCLPIASISDMSQRTSSSHPAIATMHPPSPHNIGNPTRRFTTNRVPAHGRGSKGRTPNHRGEGPVPHRRATPHLNGTPHDASPYCRSSTSHKGRFRRHDHQTDRERFSFNRMLHPKGVTARRERALARLGSLLGVGIAIMVATATGTTGRRLTRSWGGSRDRMSWRLEVRPTRRRPPTKHGRHWIAPTVRRTYAAARMVWAPYDAAGAVCGRPPRTLWLRRESERCGFGSLGLDPELDTTTSAGRFQFAVMAGLAELERGALVRQAAGGYAQAVLNLCSTCAQLGAERNDRETMLRVTKSAP